MIDKQEIWKCLGAQYIGYIPNINAFVGTKSLSAEDKLNDYDCVLICILYDIEELQSVGQRHSFKSNK
jgi:hypothetical protein